MKIHALTLLLVLCIGLSASATVNTRADWLAGTFNGTTADKPSNSNLSMGYPNGSINDNIAGFWRFDGGYNDYSGNQIPLLDSRGIGFSDGVLETSGASFVSANNPYLEYQDTAGIRESPFTFTAWIKTGSNTQDMPILEKSIGRSKGYVFLIDNYFNSDRLSLYLQSSQDNVQRFRTDVNVPENEWTHVAARYNGTDVSLYINGQKKVLVDAGQSSATYKASTQDLVIGASSGRKGGDYFNGVIDELKIFNSSLSQNQIRDDYLNGQPFRGNYVSESLSYDQPRKWEYVKTSSNLSSVQTSINITFQVSDDGFTTVKDSQTVTLQGGRELHNLNLQDAAEARFVVDGSTSNIIDTWSVESVEAEYFRDFQINDVSVNTSEFVEGRPVGASVNVSNEEPDFADVPVQVIVEKYRESTGWVEIYNEQKIFSSKGFDSSILDYSFVPDQGPHRVRAIADSSDTFNETDESNNLGSTSFDVPLYGIMYGDTTETVYLSNKKESTFYKHKITGGSGTIYFADSEASFSFTDLKPVSSYSGLGNVDQALNSTGFDDSIQNEWGEGSSIARTECFWVSGSDLCNVPVSNSTDNSFFDTGIVYDGGSTYDTADPLVFVSDMADSRKGGMGIYDYEAKVPSTLGETTGTSETIDVYMEIE